MAVLHSALLALHLLGMAAIVGVFATQLRKDSDFNTGLLLGGAITQLVTGLGLVAIHEITNDPDLNRSKIAVKLVIAILVAVAAILASSRQRRGGNARRYFHAAGGLALVNVLVAVFWQ